MSETFQTRMIRDALAGPVRQPRNSAINAGAGSIHDNATAKQLGFRGGTVAGSLHMEQFPPLLIDRLGEDWLKTGSQSLYFKYATTDGEPVQAFTEPGDASDDGHIRIWMDDAEDHRVCEGTASVGQPDENSAVRERIRSVPEPRELRILANVEVGRPGPSVPTRATREMLEERLAVITEPLPAYIDSSIYGKQIITPAMQVRLLRPGEAALLPRDGNYGVGLFGAIELSALNGPVFLEHDYETSATILAVGETPKTEYYYYESVLVDPASGSEIMKMLMMIRFMKTSSPLYQE